ncbi:MAG: hypothetical protein OEY97_07580 [Nitrospirota bacterium]|nr:hypothetical protein [Nitrospirota bacterium]
MTRPEDTSERRRRARHFAISWLVAVLMLVMLAVTFGFGALLLGYVARIANNSELAFQSVWHVWVAVPLGLLVCGGSLWLFGYGVLILSRVLTASRRLVKERA